MNEEVYRVDKTEQKGLGLFSNRKILRGELILNEQALIVIDRKKPNITNQVCEKIAHLSYEDNIKFYSLYDCYLPDTPTELGITETNCLSLAPGSNYSGIFPTVSRINHSCLPNAYSSWNDNLKAQTVYALKDIEQNEEITISYIDLYSDRAIRQKQLKKLYRFDCNCELCSMSSVDIKKSDIRRKVISQLDEEIATLAWSLPDKAIVKAEQLLKYLKDEGMFYMANYVGRVAYDVFQILFITNQMQKNMINNVQVLQNWAKMTIENYLICSGNYDCTLKKQLEFYSVI